MFKSDDVENKGEVADDTIIGRSIKIEGDLSSGGDIIIEGEVKGSVKTGQHLKIGDQAKVQANVDAESAIVSGVVEGNVSVKNTLEMTESAKIFGDVSAKTLSIAAGATFNGNCKMEETQKIEEPIVGPVDTQVSEEDKETEE